MRIKKRYFGNHCLKASLEALLQHYKASWVFLVTGKQSYSLCGAKEIVDSLIHSLKINVTHFNDFAPNPTIEDLGKGINLFKTKPHALVVAIGGGSALDIAKLIPIFAHPNNSLQDYLNGKSGINNQGIPLIAIPTTSGTGSESTTFSVLYINKVKYSVDNPHLLPRHVILDPTLTYTNNIYQSGCVSFDTLSQAIESYWAVNATSKSRIYAKKAILLSKDFLLKAVQNDKIARSKMMIATHLAGKAINISKTTAPHALSYYMTMHHNLPHGHAVALTLPLFILINAQDKGISSNIMQPLCKMFGCDSASHLSQLMQQWMKGCSLEYHFQALGIHSQALNKIVNAVNMERMNNNPVKINKSDLLKELNSYSEKISAN